MLKTLLAICIIIPLSIYLRAAFKVPKKITDPHTFYLYPKMITPIEYANSSTSYGFQISTVSVFLAWGYLYPLPAIVNTIFWGVGIFLYRAMLTRLRPFLGTLMTLHGFLGQRYASLRVRQLASVMTILGFLGLCLAELVWGSQVLMVLNPDPNFMYFTTFSMGIFVVVYLTRGGHLSVIRTDQYQLLFSYVGFLSVLFWVLYRIYSQDNVLHVVGLILSVPLIVILLVAYQSIRRSTRYEQEIEPEIKGVQRIISYMFLIAILTLAIIVLISLRSITALPKVSFQLLSHVKACGVDGWSYLSLILLPMLWQFVDITAWQRLSAVKVDLENSSDLNPIKMGLTRYGIESPFTWILAILLGIALRYSGLSFTENEVWNMIVSLPTKLLGEGTLGVILTAFFTVGILSVMLSTVDSSLIGVIFTLVYDTMSITREQIDSEVGDITAATKVIRLGVIASIVFIIIGLILYFILSALKIPILGILFGAYSCQIALFPAVFGTLWFEERVPTSGWVIGSIALGFVSGIFATVVSLSNFSWQLYPPLFSIAFSTFVYILGLLFRKFREGLQNGK
jgi:Na+/proline symporter